MCFSFLSREAPVKKIIPFAFAALMMFFCKMALANGLPAATDNVTISNNLKSRVVWVYRSSPICNTTPQAGLTNPQQNSKSQISCQIGVEAQGQFLLENTSTRLVIGYVNTFFQGAYTCTASPGDHISVVSGPNYCNISINHG